ncbi:MAG: DJ-1/PfpI family protein [Kiritimatiellae bacterium]|nr:DJ-1/PfpI family protein [Kiritimatiellia bacterium]MDD5521246.1 DJ-1/PfpI family protein [Kiritimatiellia bacterium]
MTKVLIPLAVGVEEMEAVIPIDMFRRAGWEVVSAGMTCEIVKASRDVQLVADKLWKNVTPSSFDILVLPGGAKGTAYLVSNNEILTTVRDFVKNGKIVAAICAAPLVLQAAGVLEDRKVTCHPAVAREMKIPEVTDDPVVVDGKIVTSRGAGTAFEFSLAIIEMVNGPAKADSVASEIVL